jgi:hypothetical protein
MSYKSLRRPNHRAAIELLAPKRKAFVVACKTQVFRLLLRLIMLRDKDTTGKTGCQKPNLFFHTGFIDSKLAAQLMKSP